MPFPPPVKRPFSVVKSNVHFSIFILINLPAVSFVTVLYGIWQAHTLSLSPAPHHLSWTVVPHPSHSQAALPSRSALTASLSTWLLDPGKSWFLIQMHCECACVHMCIGACAPLVLKLEILCVPMTAIWIESHTLSLPWALDFYMKMET